MRTMTVLAVALATSGLLVAQERTKSQEEYQKSRAEKLAKPVFKMAPWIFDYDEARKQAAAQDKLLLTYFTRTYSP